MNFQVNQNKDHKNLCKDASLFAVSFSKLRTFLQMSLSCISCTQICGLSYHIASLSSYQADLSISLGFAEINVIDECHVIFL